MEENPRQGEHEGQLRKNNSVNWRYVDRDGGRQLADWPKGEDEMGERYFSSVFPHPSWQV